VGRAFPITKAHDGLECGCWSGRAMVEILLPFFSTGSFFLFGAFWALSTIFHRFLDKAYSLLTIR
jgi:hypothetical protein